MSHQPFMVALWVSVSETLLFRCFGIPGTLVSSSHKLWGGEKILLSVFSFTVRFPLHSGFQEFSRRKKKSGKKKKTKKNPALGQFLRQVSIAALMERWGVPRASAGPGAAPGAETRVLAAVCLPVSHPVVGTAARQGTPLGIPPAGLAGMLRIPWHCTARQRTLGRAGLCSLVPPASDMLVPWRACSTRDDGRED